MVPSENFTLILSKDSLVVVRSIGETYGIGGQLLSCPFLHSESLNLLGLLRMVVILMCCQSVIPSMSLLNVDLSRTHRNQVACVLISVNRFCTYSQLDGLVQKKMASQKMQGFEFKVSWVFCWWEILKKIVVLPMQRMGSTLQRLSWLKIMSLVIMFEMICNGPQPMREEHVYNVDLYTISCTLIMLLRWPMYCTRVYIQGGHWSGYIFNSSSRGSGPFVPSIFCSGGKHFLFQMA